MKNVKNHAIWVDSSFLLNYEKANLAAYAKLAVPASQVKHYEPYFTWLPKAIGGDIEEASLVQVARDNKLTELLFDQKAKVCERGATDIVHLFVEAGAHVVIASPETPDALAAVVARCGFPETVGQVPLTTRVKRAELIYERAREFDRLFVLERNLPDDHAQKLVSRLADKLTLINVNCSPNRIERAVDDLASAVEREWLV